MSERILVCGSREWKNFQIIKKFLESLEKDTIIIHGGCRGADSIAGYIAKQLGLEVIVYKANWEIDGKSAGTKRNQKMLDEGQPTKVVAFHEDIENSKGTKDMVTRAKNSNLQVEIIPLFSE
jgi:ribulose 1,5-bisphosphate synthetase/thiazole synthase